MRERMRVHVPLIQQLKIVQERLEREEAELVRQYDVFWQSDKLGVATSVCAGLGCWSLVAKTATKRVPAAAGGASGCVHAGVHAVAMWQ